MSAKTQGQKNRRTALTLALLVLGMFGFGFALAPLYDLFCRVTGIQSIALESDAPASAAPPVRVDLSRTLTIKFDTTVHPSLPWRLQVAQQSLQIHPGEIYEITFSAYNQSHEQVTGQAIPSVVPWQATPFFSKLECFCFQHQTLAGNASAVMPLRFMVSPDLPKEIRSLTLSYSFMKLDPPSLPTPLPGRQIIVQAFAD